MSKFAVDKSFWELFPNAKIGVVLLKDMHNDRKIEELTSLLEKANQDAKKYLIMDVFSENPVVKVYRDAYQKFKTKKGARCSIEALLKRVEKDNPVSNINPLVDIYNAASLTYGLPVGAEDIDSFVGDLRLTVTKGNDEFYLINEEENNPTLPGELCYKDEHGAVCRCFNWRDGARTMIRETSKNAFCVIELLDNSREEELNKALEMIGSLSEKYLQAKTVIKVLDINDAEISFD